MVDIAGVTDTASDKSEADTLKLKAGKSLCFINRCCSQYEGVSVGGDVIRRRMN